MNEITWSIWSKTTGEVFRTSDDWEWLMRELAYLTRQGYNVEIR